MLRAAFVAIACGLVLTACGQSTADRALTGAGIGAAAGGAASAVTGGNVLGSVAVGGAAGGAAGALTDEEDVDLGEPAWD